MDKDTALDLALEALEEAHYKVEHKQDAAKREHAIAAIKQARLAQQEPVAYNKTEMNGFIQDLYDKKMQEGKHGHYETMFHCVHQAIAKVTPPAAQRQWVGLTDEQILAVNYPDGEENGPTVSAPDFDLVCFARAIEAKLKEKNA